MSNIILTQRQYYSLLSTAPVFALGTGAVFLYGFPIYPIGNHFLIYQVCEYCGQKACKCGAPKEIQGIPIPSSVNDSSSISDFVFHALFDKQ